jgi:superfamily II DNA or RNA helicase
MKQEKLKETETKQIVIATYSMASEALDIKSLSSLIMITPKTDVTQSIGRILREKHAFTPIVVDIVDIHRPLVNQFNKRKTFYKQQKYNVKYLGWGESEWKEMTSNKHSSGNKKSVDEVFLEPKKCYIDFNLSD